MKTRRSWRNQDRLWGALSGPRTECRTVVESRKCPELNCNYCGGNYDSDCSLCGAMVCLDCMANKCVCLSCAAARAEEVR